MVRKDISGSSTAHRSTASKFVDGLLRVAAGDSSSEAIAHALEERLSPNT